jgi:hypothetical protein
MPILLGLEHEQSDAFDLDERAITEAHVPCTDVSEDARAS